MLIKNNGSEATEVTCVNKVQNNSNACSCVAQLKVKNESMCSSMQTGCEGTLRTSASESQFLYCSENGTDISDTHDVSRFLELGRVEDRFRMYKVDLKGTQLSGEMF